jgi:catechol 2,3-dioxygenase-like lactoylglutathione lyase family enzyme
MPTAPTGLHHVTAIATEPQRNADFYRTALGLRLVKKTVNFDAPDTYHLYFGNESGQPGTLITFFPWPGSPRGRRGAGQATTVSRRPTRTRRCSSSFEPRTRPRPNWATGTAPAWRSTPAVGTANARVTKTLEVQSCPAAKIYQPLNAGWS